MPGPTHQGHGGDRPSRSASMRRRLALARARGCEYKRGVEWVPPGGTGPAQLELRLAGVFGVVRDGVPLADGELGSRKARTLLKLLAVERGRLVSVDRIAEALWAGGPPAELMANVATLVSRLRRTLGPEVIHGGRQ